MTHPRLWQAALAAYWATLLVATHVPRDFPGVPGNSVDKLVHMAAFAVLAGLLAMAWRCTVGRLNAAHLRAAWLVVVVYAALDEATQPLVGRVGAWDDWLADAAGTAAGLVIFKWGARWAAGRSLPR